VKELLYNPFTPRIVELFSGDGSGRLDFQRFLHMMSVFSSRASAEAKIVWAFALWDFDGTLPITRNLMDSQLFRHALSRGGHGIAIMLQHYFTHVPCQPLWRSAYTQKHSVADGAYRSRNARRLICSNVRRDTTPPEPIGRCLYHMTAPLQTHRR
jgi:hypothetical protein